MGAASSITNIVVLRIIGASPVCRRNYKNVGERKDDSEKRRADCWRIKHAHIKTEHKQQLTKALGDAR